MVFDLGSHRTFQYFDKKYIQIAKFDLLVFFNQAIDYQTTTRILDLKSKGKLFVVIQKNYVTSICFENLIKIAIRNGILDIIFIIGNDNGFKKVYTWNPYSTKNSCGRYFNLEKVDRIRNKKIPTSTSGCSLRVTWLQAYPFVGNTSQAKDPGLLINLFNTFEYISKVNIDYHFDPEFQSEFVNNGSVFKATKYLIDDRTDVLIGQLFMNSTDGIEFGPMFFQDKSVFIIPKPPPTRIYRRLLKAFDFKVWIIYISLFMFVSLTYCMFLKWYGSTLEIGHVLLDNFSLSIGGGMRRLPSRIGLRMLLLFYCLYIININDVYIAKLSGMLTVPTQGIQLVDTESLYYNHIFFNMSWYSERCTALYHKLNNKDFQGNIYILNQTDADILRDVSDITNKAVLTFSTIMAIYRYNIPFHGIIFSNLDRVTLSLSYFLRANNVLNPVVRYWSKEMVEKGFVRKWWEDILLHNINYTLLREGIAEKENYVVLSLRHYEEAFLMLLHGYTFATVVLLIEFVWVRIGRRLDYMRINSKF
ncbi:hypothetical protein Trydic_g8455 [Trypoxylus dichotomus]